MQKENCKKILIFPGQGSQYGGMSAELTKKFAKTNIIFECGADILGYDLKSLLCDANENNDEKLADTRYAQPAIFAASLISLIAAQELDIADEYNASAGHSLGEYAALCSCGAFDAENGFKAIKARGEIMSAAGKANPGAMTAVIGLSAEQIAEVCNEVNNGGDYVTIANYNSPVQTVISGTLAAIDKAEALLKAKGARRTLRLKTSGAFHSELMQSAADEFKSVAEKLTFSPAKTPFYSNVTGGLLDNFEQFGGLPSYLAKQICSPVNFVAELLSIQKDGYDTFVETGPGNVLSGLVGKTLKDVTVMATDKLDFN